MKQQLAELLARATQSLARQRRITIAIAAENIRLEPSRSPEHGDFSSNFALAHAKSLGMQPRALAEAVVQALPESSLVARTEIAGPGFINFFLAPGAAHHTLLEILSLGTSYGRGDFGTGKRVLVEYVSANPTGPLHVGHGRGAAYGSCIVSLLRATGHEVHSEYYLNDAGRQMDILALSLWLRYLSAVGESLPYPENCYQGDYLMDTARDLARDRVHHFHVPAEDVFQGIEAPTDGHDQERHLDTLIGRAKSLLGEQRFAEVHEIAMRAIVDDIRQDLEEFSVSFDRWFAESELVRDGSLRQALDQLRDHGALYESDGATWFRSSELGDSKDRVVIRDNGEPTYFATDIAYHLNKLQRSYHQLINIWGADHHGYVPRVKAALRALQRNPRQLHVLLVQFAALYRAGKKLPMSTRAGQFVTLRELRQEVGNDAARFFYLQRKSDQHMDFDLDLAKARSNENPVYYLQYAHARICSVLRQVTEKHIAFAPLTETAALLPLVEDHEVSLIARLGRFPEVIEHSARDLEPHQLTYYLRELATDFHAYYNAHAFLVDDKPLRDARLTLILAVRQVMQNGLDILGVSAPQTM